MEDDTRAWAHQAELEEQEYLSLKGDLCLRQKRSAMHVLKKDMRGLTYTHMKQMFLLCVKRILKRYMTII